MYRFRATGGILERVTDVWKSDWTTTYLGEMDELYDEHGLPLDDARQSEVPSSRAWPVMFSSTIAKAQFTIFSAVVPQRCYGEGRFSRGRVKTPAVVNRTSVTNKLPRECMATSLARPAIPNFVEFPEKPRMVPLHQPTYPAALKRLSPMLRAVCLTFDHIDAIGPIALTPSRALKRYFVEWAAEKFEWPSYTSEDLYAVNKVLNEDDFPPLAILHELLLSTRLARHRQGALHMTRLARQLRSDPAALWTLLARQFLFATDHTGYTRFGDRPFGNWDIFLNVINVEAQGGLSKDRLCEVLYGPENSDGLLDAVRTRAALYIHVLRPLCRTGLASAIHSLSRTRRGRGSSRLDQPNVKGPGHGRQSPSSHLHRRHDAARGPC